MSSTAEARVVRIRVVEGVRKLTVRCPFCGREHEHDGGPENEDLSRYLGHRLSRCRIGERRQYRLVYPYD